MLTGKYFFRKTLCGLVLFVEYRDYIGSILLKYRKATEIDIIKLKLYYIEK
jgi:hypothetical protein